MSTPMDRRTLEAYVDGELDLKSQLDVEQALRGDGALQRQVDEARQLRDAVRGGASYHEAPAALRERLRASMGARAAPPAPQREPAPPRGRRIAELLAPWFGWRPLVSSLAVGAALAVSLNMALLQGARTDRLAQEVVGSHVRAVLRDHLVDVASSDHHTVKPYLSSKLGFSPPVAALPVSGSEFLGGRLDYIDGQSVAVLVYRQGPHVVNSFCWPSSTADSKPAFLAERGYLMAHWVHNGMTHWVISDVNKDEFRTIVDAVQATDTSPPEAMSR